MSEQETRADEGNNGGTGPQLTAAYHAHYASCLDCNGDGHCSEGLRLLRAVRSGIDNTKGTHSVEGEAGEIANLLADDLEASGFQIFTDVVADGPRVGFTYHGHRYEAHPRYHAHNELLNHVVKAITTASQSQATDVQVKSADVAFDRWWVSKVTEGYQYGRDPLATVRFGFENGFAAALTAQPPPGTWCWHCGVRLEDGPKPRCEQCPAECDTEGCEAMGCSPAAPSPPTEDAKERAREIVGSSIYEVRTGAEHSDMSNAEPTLIANVPQLIDRIAAGLKQLERERNEAAARMKAAMIEKVKEHFPLWHKVHSSQCATQESSECSCDCESSDIDWFIGKLEQVEVEGEAK